MFGVRINSIGVWIVAFGVFTAKAICKMGPQFIAVDPPHSRTDICKLSMCGYTLV